MSAQNTTEPRRIIINLNNSREASRLEKNEIIQQEALDQFENLIEQIKGRIDNFTTNLNSDDPIRAVRTHDVITVDGRRGSGKTTFILSAFESLKDEIKKDICFLDIIDPTLIETREHVFVTIVSLIKRKVDNTYKNSCTKNNEDKYKAWRKSLEELANGMRLLDGIGQNHLKSDSWMDEHFALEHGIQNAQSGRDLELSFHRYIAASLGFIGQKAFLIAFDDIDTDFSKGWPVLEMIRKYLTTPQLITVLSGDLQLYSTLVEKQQWENLGLGFNTDNKKQNQFRPMIEELVDQYLLKILRTPNRIELKSIGHYVDNYSYGISVIRRGKTTERNLKQALEQICTEILCMRQKELTRKTIKQLTELPTRTIVSLLFSLENYTNDAWELIKSNDKLNPNYGQIEQKNRQAAILALSDVFLRWLQNIDYRRHDFEQSDSSKIISTLIKNTLKHNLLPEAAELKATFSEQSINNAMFVIGAFVSNTIFNTPKAYFDYVLRVSLTANSMRELSTEGTHKKEFDSNTYGQNHIANQYIKHLGILEGESTLNIARKYISLIWPSNFNNAKNRIALQNGTIQLYSTSASERGDTRKIKEHLYVGDTPPTALVNFRSIINSPPNVKNQTIGVFINNASTLERNITSWHKYIAMLPVSNNRAGEDTYPHFSIFNLLGAISQLLSSDNLQYELESIGVIRDYPVFSPSVTGASSSTGNSPIKSDDLETDSPQVDEEFISAFNLWKESFPNQRTQPTHTSVISKAWTRFFFAIKRLPEALPHEQCFAGTIMHRWIVIFLNSLLVEEGVSADVANLKLKNPTTSDNIFCENLKILEKSKTIVPLFNWIFSCPIWMLFLDDDKDETFIQHLYYMTKENIISRSSDMPKLILPKYKFNSDDTDEGSASLFDCLNSLAIVGMGTLKIRTDSHNDEDNLAQMSIDELLTKYPSEKLDSFESKISFYTNVENKNDMGYYYKTCDLLSENIALNKYNRYPILIKALQTWTVNTYSEQNYTTLSLNNILKYIFIVTEIVNSHIDKNTSDGDKYKLVRPKSLSPAGVKDFIIPAIIKYVLTPTHIETAKQKTVTG